MRNPNARTFEERSIEWTLSVKEKTVKAAWIYTERVQSSRFIFWQSKLVIQTESREQCFFISYDNFEEENSLWVRELQFTWWAKRDLIPEEQDTIQKSKDPSVMMTSNGTIQFDWRSKRKCLWFGHFMFKFDSWKNHPLCSRCVKCAKKTLQVRHQISPRMGEQSSVKRTTTFPWWSQACKKPNTKPKFWSTRNRHKLRATTGAMWKHNNPEWLQPFTEGLTRGSSSSTDVSPADVAIPPPAIPPSAHDPTKTTSNKAGGKAQFIHSSSQRPELQSIQTRESYKGVMQQQFWRSGGQNWDFRKIWGYDHSRPQGSEWRTRL